MFIFLGVFDGEWERFACAVTHPPFPSLDPLPSLVLEASEVLERAGRPESFTFETFQKSMEEGRPRARRVRASP